MSIRRLWSATRSERTGALETCASQSFIHPTVAASTEWCLQAAAGNWRVPCSTGSEDSESWYRSAGGSRFVTIERLLLYYREVGGFSLERDVGSDLGLFLLSSRYAREHRVLDLCTRPLDAWRSCSRWPPQIRWGWQTRSYREEVIHSRRGNARPRKNALAQALACPVPGGFRYSDAVTAPEPEHTAAVFASGPADCSIAQ